MRMVLRYFQSMPENENMQNVIPFPFDIYDAMWYDDADDNDDDGGDDGNDETAMFGRFYARIHYTVFVYKSAVMCHFHGNHVSNALPLSLFFVYSHYGTV